MKEDEAMAAKRGATVKVVDSQFGRVIADRRGEAFYLFDKEKGKRSRCYGECAVAWPPVLTKGKPRAGTGADADLLGTTKRRNGKLQATYNGHPLYYYKDDEPGPHPVPQRRRVRRALARGEPARGRGELSEPLSRPAESLGGQLSESSFAPAAAA